jgi:hypothetical protein
MFRRLITALRSFFMRPADATEELDCQLDLDAWAAQLDLDRLGDQAGRHELPATTTSEPNDAERKVGALIEQRMSALTDDSNQRLGRYNTTIADTDINSQQQRLLNLSNNSTLRLRNLMAETRQALCALKAEKQRYSDYFDEFKQHHRRNVDARYPQSRLLHYGVVAVLLLVESLLNGYFFARGSEFGLLGGVSQSITVAVLNILPAFFIAGLVLLRYSHHVSFFKRNLARLGLLAYLGWIGLFNLGVAHYRDLLASRPDDALTLTLGQLSGQPLLLADINSWLLLLVGLLFALIAAWDGYRSDDPYPGYGSRQRWFLDLEAYYQQETRRLSQQVATLRSDYLDELQRLSAQAHDLYPHLFHLVEQKRALIERHRNCLQDLQAAGDALIHRYRQANRQARSTPAPAFFDQPWRSQRDYLLVGTDDDQAKIAGQQQLFETLPARIQQASNDIETLYSEFLSEIQGIDPDRSEDNFEL